MCVKNAAQLWLSSALDCSLLQFPLVFFAGHDCCETVKVALCASKEGRPVLVVAEESFKFIQDEAYDAAQFLATYAGNQQALNFTRFLDQSRPPAADVDILDEKVALAFRHLKLPAEWNVLGTDQSLNGEKHGDVCEVWVGRGVKSLLLWEPSACLSKYSLVLVHRNGTGCISTCRTVSVSYTLHFSHFEIQVTHVFFIFCYKIGRSVVSGHCCNTCR